MPKWWEPKQKTRNLFQTHEWQIIVVCVTFRESYVCGKEEGSKLGTHYDFFLFLTHDKRNMLLILELLFAEISEETSFYS